MDSRRGALAAVAIVVVAAAVLLRGSSTPGAAPKGEGPGSSQSVVESPAKAATTYLNSFADNYAADAAVVTDPAATTAALTEVRAALKPTKVEAALTQVAPTAGEAAKTSGMFRVSWTFGPGRVWSYDNSLELVRSGQKWLVHWTPALHPKLEAGPRLALGTVSDQQAVVERDGKPLVSSALQPAEDNPAPLLQGGLSKIAQEHVSPNDTFSIALVEAGGDARGGQPAQGSHRTVRPRLDVQDRHRRRRTSAG
jgi:hypothetical protein